jgi:hypothetical protein
MHINCCCCCRRLLLILLCNRGKVGKAPKRGAIEVFVQFEDDEDETGKTPNRRVPANLVTQLLA